MWRDGLIEDYIALTINKDLCFVAYFCEIILSAINNLRTLFLEEKRRSRFPNALYQTAQPRCSVTQERGFVT